MPTFMRTLFTNLAVVAAGLAAGPAFADMCQTPFMHDGGHVKLSGSGMLTLGADLNFSNVKKHGGNTCEARVQGKAIYGLAGLPPGNTKVDYWMKVANGKASFERDDGNGGREPVQGKFDLRMLGLFSYAAPITRPGQTFPAQHFQVNVDKHSSPIVIRTGERTVGERQKISTAAGEQSCWPLRYTRVSDPTQASFNGLVLPVPGMTSAVTDWYCPDVSMVMKQDSVQNGVASSVVVTEVK